MTKQFAYIRVSTEEQNIARQLEAMKALNIGERDLYIDKQSGKDFDRKQYQAMKAQLREGDTVFIKSLDRFGRNMNEIMNEWNEITKIIGADICVLDMPLLDTRNKDIGSIADLVLSILSWVAQEERTRIRERQAQGIEAAKKEGKHLGRPLSATVITDEFKAIYALWKAKKITGVEATEKAGVSKGSFYKMVKEFEAGK